MITHNFKSLLPFWSPFNLSSVPLKCRKNCNQWMFFQWRSCTACYTIIIRHRCFPCPDRKCELLQELTSSSATISKKTLHSIYWVTKIAYSWHCATWTYWLLDHNLIFQIYTCRMKFEKPMHSTSDGSGFTSSDCNTGHLKVKDFSALHWCKIWSLQAGLKWYSYSSIPIQDSAKFFWIHKICV